MKVRKILSLSSTNRAVQKVLGYEFRNQLLLQEAFQAPGLHNKKGFLPLETGHKRLASVGDAVLMLLVKERLYHLKLPVGARFPLVKRLVSNANLSAVFKRLDFEKYLRVEKPEDAGNTAVTADAMESIIGAVYLDSSLQPTLQVCSRIGLMPTLKSLQSEFAKEELGEDMVEEEQQVGVIPETTIGVEDRK